MNENSNALLSELLHQEQVFQFDEFGSATALEIGLSIVAAARKAGTWVMVEIRRDGQQRFLHAMEGTGQDNVDWIRRKNNVVNRFKHSSFYVWSYCNSLDAAGGGHCDIDPDEYAVCGGAFPIWVKDVGMVGTITVSGLPHEQDHELVVSVLSSFFY